MKVIFMHDIHRLLRAAAWRLGVVSFARHLVIALAAMLAAFIILRLVQQLWPLEAPLPWLLISCYSTGGAALLALGWTIVRRESPKAVARRVDEGADLRESLSTALCVEGTDDPWAKMTVESAATRARSVNLKHAVPLNPPKFWPVPLALALSLLVVWLAISPRQSEERIAKQQEKANILQVKSQAQDVKKIEDIVAKLDPVRNETPTDGAGTDKPGVAVTPQEISLQAIKKLTSAMDRLEQLRQGEQGQMNKALSDMLKELKTPGPGPLAEMSRKLASGDFGQAAKELADQLSKLQKGEMSEQEKKALTEQLAKLSKQLAELSQNRQEAEKELAKAGLSKDLAQETDPEKLAQALKNAKDLTDEQRKQLADLINAQAKSRKAMDTMNKAMSQMAESIEKNGQMDPNALNAMQELAEQMGELEKLSQNMSTADSAMAEAKAQIAALSKFCDSPGDGSSDKPGFGSDRAGQFMPGDPTNRPGNGSGGPGQGQGSSRTEQEAAYTLKLQKNKTKTQSGPTIASEIIKAAEQERGESTARVTEAVAAANQNASEAMEANHIPREFHDAVKHYFGRLKAKTKAVGTSPPDAPKDGAKSDDAKKDDGKKDDTK